MITYREYLDMSKIALIVYVRTNTIPESYNKKLC